jgi:transketolase
VLNAIAPQVKNLIGGSADLAPSNKTLIKGEGDFEAGNFDGRNLHFGVREHGMGGILNGMALHGGLIPYGGTFLIFSDYMRPAIRLASLMTLKVIYVFTHDSIGLGEDGPTHQPVEHLSALRAIPNLTVLRPCDAAETVEAWCFALEQKKGPFALALTRQTVPILDRTQFASAQGLRQGAYILSEPAEGNPDIVLMGSGSEVHLALEASRRLHEKGIRSRVVSMPSWELFDAQPEEYRSRVLPKHLDARLAVEAGVAHGWHRYVGDKGGVVSLERFGASAPYKTLYEKFGLTVERVVEQTLKLLNRS